MTSSAPRNASFTQAQELQRQLEGIILKLEKTGLLQERAGDHIRVIVAEGIAESFGDRYRAYPSVPRPDNVAIRRDLAPMPCVLAPPEKKKNVKKGNESVAAGTNVSSPANTVTITSRGTTRRLSAWAAGVADASPASTSPEKSITYETRLAANAARWDAILDNPVELSPAGSRGSYAFSGRKTVKRVMSSPSPSKNTSTKKLPVTVKAAVANDTTGTINAERSDLEVFFAIPARHASPKDKETVIPPSAAHVALNTAITATIDDCNDWLIDLSS